MSEKTMKIVDTSKLEHELTREQNTPTQGVYLMEKSDLAKF